MKDVVPIGATCCVCRWWHPPEPSSKSGECHRTAPVKDGWPVTQYADVCGEWTTDYAPEERTGRLAVRSPRP